MENDGVRRDDDDNDDGSGVANGDDGCDDDVEVMWEGSPLFQHLASVGFDVDGVADPDHDVVIGPKSAKMRPGEPDREPWHVRRRAQQQQQQQHRRHHQVVDSGSSSWATGEAELLEVGIARKILESQLLVPEDRDFLSSFVLTREALDRERDLLLIRKNADDERASSSSSWSSLLVLSGSVAAVAGAVLLLSERSRMAAAAAAGLLPAFLAFSSNSGGGAEEPPKSEELELLVGQMLEDMGLFKGLVRKSLNLLQGMELIRAGNRALSVDPVTGGALPKKVRPEESADEDDEGLAVEFPALRKAVYLCTVRTILAYREAVKNLMVIGPLAEHVDMRQHYIAFVDLAKFNIDADHNPEVSALTVERLRDAAQVALVQQSEYLRRFSVSFSEKARVLDEADTGGLGSEDSFPGGGRSCAVVGKPAVVRHVRNLVASLRKVNARLSRVLEYHQAMGCQPVGGGAEAKAPARLRRSDALPLRSVYTSLFSTGLHLQNSLLRVRRMEKLFELLLEVEVKVAANRKAAGDDEADDREHQVEQQRLMLARWLKGFQSIQTELGACVGCLEEGVNQIDLLQQDQGAKDRQKGQGSSESPTSTGSSTGDGMPPKSEQPPIRIEGDDDIEGDRMYEIFEAVVDDGGHGEVGPPDEDHSRAMTEQREFSKQLKAEQLLLKELKSALTVKAAQRQVLEAEAAARLGLAPPERIQGDEVEGSKSPKLVPKADKKPKGSRSRTKDPFRAVNFLPILKTDPDSPVCNGFEDSFVDSLVVPLLPTCIGSSDLSEELDSFKGPVVEGTDSDRLEETPPMSVIVEDAAANVSQSSSWSSSSASGTNSSASPSGKGRQKKGPSRSKGRSHASFVGDGRSLSTPDLKRLPAAGDKTSCETESSPYISLEKLGVGSGRTNEDHSEASEDDEECQQTVVIGCGTESDSSSDWGSVDELDTETSSSQNSGFLHKNMFRRPLRPAALKAAASKGVVQSPAVKPTDIKLAKDLEDTSGWGRRTEVKNPPGFDAFLARQVAAKAKSLSKSFNFMSRAAEQVFGDDSDVSTN